MSNFEVKLHVQLYLPFVETPCNYCSDKCVGNAVLTVFGKQFEYGNICEKHLAALRENIRPPKRQGV